MDTWKDGKFDKLVEDTVQTLEEGLSNCKGKMTDKVIQKTIHQKSVQGDLRGAVCFLKEREAG